MRSPDNFPKTANLTSFAMSKIPPRQDELEQLERLRSEETPRRLMITLTIE